MDAKALGLKDYNTIITHPMDLGTVTRKLEADEYETEEDFCKDVALTFNNAKEYNPIDEEIHLIAVQLMKKFRDQWAKARPDSGANDALDSRELNGDAVFLVYLQHVHSHSSCPPFCVSRQVGVDVGTCVSVSCSLSLHLLPSLSPPYIVVCACVCACYACVLVCLHVHVRVFA